LELIGINRKHWGRMGNRDRDMGFLRFPSADAKYGIQHMLPATEKQWEGWAIMPEVENLKIRHPDLATEEKPAKSHFGVL